MGNELAPPGDHRRKLVDRTIQTTKGQFVSIMCGVDKTFPIHLWCRLILQAELTLNLLCQSNIAPKVTACEHVYGTQYFVRKPFAPMGYAVQCREKADKRKM